MATIGCGNDFILRKNQGYNLLNISPQNDNIGPKNKTEEDH